MENLYTKLALYHSKGVKLEKDKENPYFKSRYMSLDNIVNTITPVLNEIGLVLYHTVDIDEGIKYVNSVLADPESGEKIESYFPINGTDPQKVGSEISYGKRYNTSCLLNIVDSEDDDGNSATDDIKNAPIRDDVPQTPTGPTEWIDKAKIAKFIEKLKTGELVAGSQQAAVALARQYYKVSKDNADLIMQEFSKQII